jgi:hypothetical protein
MTVKECYGCIHQLSILFLDNRQLQTTIPDRSISAICCIVCPAGGLEDSAWTHAYWARNWRIAAAIGSTWVSRAK